ncbi:ScpA family protein [Jannaschia sp. LMIT008]|uniref:segregation and condensation protein A n=1 Tax=Jannaschia maritima TaxID=3032585 RepID=UPI0028110D3A|nr:ScpA family protein [Jannaschia sp. LMIT008]
MKDVDDLREGAVAPRREAADTLVVDVEGYEGPLDVLLALARSQKVDLRQVSIVQLARQYLGFVEEARALRIELAADYLVMAAWLAYLKSRLLLPPDPCDGGPTGDELAARLAFQLRRLEAMRRAAADLGDRARLGRERFARGMPTVPDRTRDVIWTANLIDLLRAYARTRTKDEFRPFVFDRRHLMTMEEALDRLRPMLGTTMGWSDLMRFLPGDVLDDPARLRSAVAATFAAALELARHGQVELEQTVPFAPIRVRARS